MTCANLLGGDVTHSVNTPEVFPGDFVNCFLLWALISSKICGDKAGLASRGAG